MDVQVQGGPPVTIDCSSTGAGQLVTKPINVKIINGEPQKLEVQLNIPVSKNKEQHFKLSVSILFSG